MGSKCCYCLILKSIYRSVDCDIKTKKVSLGMNNFLLVQNKAMKICVAVANSMHN